MSRRSASYRGPLPAPLGFDPAMLSGEDEVWSWFEALQQWGPRLTGTPAHAASIDWLADRFRETGLEPVRHRRAMRRWTAKAWSLAIEGQPPLTAFYFPYSGATPPAGVTGRLVWYDSPPSNFSKAQGGIAVIALKAQPTNWFVQKLMYGPRLALPADAAFGGTVGSPLLQGLALGVNMDRAAADGVLGLVLVWQGISDVNAAEQHTSFFNPLKKCPTLWAPPSAAPALKAAADAGDKATLVLDAVVDAGVETDSLHAILPGSHPTEAIIVNTHSDGPNACEENGPAGLLAMARYAAAILRERRNRTLVFVSATGHFQLPQLGGGGQATHAWLDAHRPLWDGAAGHLKAVAGLTLEHLGCMEWKDRSDPPCYGPTGKVERELVYATNPVMRRIYAEAVSGRTKLRSLVLVPHNGLFFGEGEPLFKAGIPSISLVPTPDYLLREARDGCLPQLDRTLVRQQLETFTKAWLQLDMMPASLIGRVEAGESNLLGRALDVLRRRHA